MYKLQEGLDEEQREKFHKDLERTASRVQHPLALLRVEPPVQQVDRLVSEPKRERKPPPGWKSDREAFNNAMGLMNFVGKRR